MKPRGINRRNEIKLSDHAYQRLLERSSFKGDRKKADNYCKNAFRNGIPYAQFSQSEKKKLAVILKDPLHKFSAGKITLYNNNLFIFNQNNKCITVLAV